MARPSRSNPLALAVLVSLYEKPMHPYEVAQTLRHRAKQESVRLNYGSLYAVVESLEKKGLIKATGTVRDGKRPERTIYQITDDGAREMNEWMTELISVPGQGVPRLHGRHVLHRLAASRRGADGAAGAGRRARSSACSACAGR